MLKHQKSKLNEFGSLMIEAMAMLALISMVTPILYKKSAERTTELQDINAASEVRSLIKSLDDYVSDHYDDIIQGNTVSQNCKTGSVSYADMAATTGESTQKKTVNINHFCEYLPYGFLDKDKEAQASKTFSKNYQVVLKKVDGGDGRKRVITAFLITEPSDGGTFPKLRASRIASMIGSNGGYINVASGKASAMGTQGIWSVDDLNGELGVAASKVKDGAIIASSVQGIAAQGGVDNENVLYRKYRTNRELNTMETDLLMGTSDALGNNIKRVNQMIIAAGRPANFAENAGDVESALYIKNGGATIKSGIKAADAKFVVDNAGTTTAVKFIADNFLAESNLLRLGDGTTGLNVTNSGLTIGYSGGTWNAETGITGAPVNINANTKITGNLHVTGNEYLGGDLRIGGTLDANKLHARTQLSVGGTPAAPTNAIVTETSSVFKQPDFRIGGTGSSDARLFTNATQSVLRGGTAGLLLESSQNVLMQSNTTSGKVEVKSGTGGTLIDSTGEVKITSGSTDSTPITLNETMMKLYPQSVQIKSIVNSFLIGNTEAYTSEAAANAAYVKADVASRQLKTKKSRLIVTDGSGINSFVVDPGGTGIASTAAANTGYATMRGKFSVLNNDLTNVLQVNTNNQKEATTANPATVVVNDDFLKVNNMVDASRVLTVDVKAAQAAETSTANKGEVYIRKGVMELAANTGSGVKTLDKHKGYVKADRFVANHNLDGSALSKPTDFTGAVQQGTSGAYDYYQVNPAYTSVMHDIKLTTRGGARLSDILPDFINKGIYIVDNTYKEDAVGNNWSTRDANGYHSGSFNPTGSYADCGTTHSCAVSPWAGFVPAPQCPPGYLKVITLMPATFSMAQAGVPGPKTSTKPDLIIDYNARDPNEYVDGYTGTKHYNKSGYITTAPIPLYFQKNTWLRSMVIPYMPGGNNANFKGWSAVMGFIYPYSYYKKYIELLGLTPSGADSKTVIWNLFPVYNQSLEGYATVYCYFNRAESVWNSNLVDKTYDQLNAFRAVHQKNNTGYVNRLNDPTLGYTDPW